MQINTIEARLDGLEKAKPGKKDGKDSAAAESAFAACFANARHDVHRTTPGHGVTQDDNGSVEHIDTVRERPSDSARTTNGAQGIDVESAAEPARAAQDPVKAGASEAAAHDGNGQAVAATAGPAKHSHATHAATPGENAPSVSVEVAVTQTASAPATALLPNDKAAPTGPPATTAPMPAVAATPAGEAEVIAAVQQPSDETTPVTPANAQDTAETAPETAPVESSSTDDGAPLEAGPQPQPKVAAAKPAAHAKALATPAVEADAVDKTVSTPNSGPAEAAVPVDKDPDNADATADVSVAARGPVDSTARAPSAEPQTVRTVTQLTAPDGSLVATRTTESRTEATHATGQREVVVIERTTIQALPEQALRGVRFLTGNGDQTMRIRLVPESLGEVRLEVTAANGGVNVRLASASAAVREILQTHAPGLQSAIAQDHAGVVRVTVTADVSPQAWLSGNAQRHGGQHDAPAPQRHAPAAYHAPTQPLPVGPRREAAHTGNLNVYV